MRDREGLIACIWAAQVGSYFYLGHRESWMKKHFKHNKLLSIGALVQNLKS